jgi:ankyrin repeat protein
MISVTNETLEMAISKLINSDRRVLRDAKLRDESRLIYGCELNDADLSDEPPDDCAKLRRIIAAGADVNARFKFEQTALMYACEGSLSAARVLIELGADVNAIGNFGSNALFVAIGNKQNEIVELLIQNGADIHSESTSTLNNGRFNSSPIVYAVAVSNLTAVKLLLENGANPNTKNRNGDTPLGRATVFRNINNYDTLCIYDLVIERGATLPEQTETALVCTLPEHTENAIACV